MAKRVFIGSSTESKDHLASQIAEALSHERLKPVRWWSHETFPGGCNLLARLRELASECDGAVFVAAADDETWYRDTKHDKPRDNVIFELGMFLAHLGSSRCIVVKSPSVTLPTDLGGVVYVNVMGNDTEGAATRAAKFLAASIHRRDENIRSLFSLRIDPHVMRNQIANGRKDWLYRNIYFGLEGARAWLDLSRTHENHSIGPIEPAVLAMISQEERSFDTLLSLGPGDGQADRFVLEGIRSKSPNVQYIPADISEGLLHATYEGLHKRVQIPFGILGDFEDGFPFIWEQMEHRRQGCTLISLLGNTFGNLDGDESVFLSEVRNAMGEDDQLLIEAAVFKKEAKPAPVNIQDWKAARVRFFALGATRKLNVDFDDVCADPLKYFSKEHTEGFVPGSDKISIYAESNGNKCLLAVARNYDEEQLCTWLTRNNWKVRSHRVPQNGIVDTCLFLLSKKK